MERPSVGMTVRRSGARLRAMAKAHGPLHVLLWQERHNQLLAAAAAQKTLFSDIAAWASTENRALSDVCVCVSELSSFYTAALAQLAIAYKSFRKEMGLVLEGERRCDNIQKKLHDAENKRIKFRRQVLRVQNRTQTNGESRRSGDFTALQTQLAEAERQAERAHMEACDTSREQEAVKLVVVKSAIAKLSESHLKLAPQSKTIFEGSRELSEEVPEPPPPGDPLSCIRYAGYDNTKGIVQRIKGQVSVGQLSISFGSSTTTPGSSRPMSTSTPLTSPNSSIWSPDPSAPTDTYSQHEPPPPYNTSYLRSIIKKNSSPRRLYQNLGSVSSVSSVNMSHNFSNVSVNSNSSAIYSPQRLNNSRQPNNQNIPPSPAHSSRY